VPRPRSLDSEDIARAALSILDRDGLSALTMRALAAELGMGTMSAYRYVDGREELERLVVDCVLSTLDFEVSEVLPWEARIVELAERVRRAVAAHPAVLPLLVAHRHSCEALRRFGETVLAIFAGAGLDGVERVLSFRALLSYIVGALQMEQWGPLSGSGTQVLAARPRRTTRDSRKPRATQAASPSSWSSARAWPSCSRA
jgi:AcrR family transcriptional regulator